MSSNFLPQGDSIRQLLAKSNITNANINSLLREKGVFVGNGEKNISVPIIMKSLISPNDFKTLYSTQRSKEDNIKYRTASISCNQDFELQQVFVKMIDLNKAILEKNTYKPNHKIIGQPNYHFPDDNTCVVDYTIERANLLNDWTNNKSLHKGSVYITKTKDSGIQVTVQQNSTSKETNEINRLILSHIKETLKTQSIATENSEFISVRFSDFNNTNRVKFLNSFSTISLDDLNFVAITDAEFDIDPESKGHEDIRQFLEEIDKIKLNGKQLNNHLLFSKEVYFSKLLMSSVTIKYKYPFKGTDILVTISYSFPEFQKSKELNSELQTLIELSSKRGLIQAAQDEIKKKLLPHIEKKKIESYDALKK